MAPAVSSVKPAASRRNVPPPVPQQAGLIVTRVKNAKQLRHDYSELQQAPDGCEPDPLTLPKCVECGHCGWPVYPRDAKIATKKTFARAGIERGTKKEEEERRRKLLEGGDANDAASTDSRDTVERMADEIEDLKDRNELLKSRNEDLEIENEKMTKELEECKEALQKAEDRIEFLEEAELRWREKLSQARLEIERLKQVLERGWMVSADRETGLITSLIELRALKEKFALFQRRRDLMLRALEQRMEAKDIEDAKAIMIRLWRSRAVKDHLQSRLDENECRRQREVRELGVQLSCEREMSATLRATGERLRARLKQAGHRLLQKSLGAGWPSALDHAFRAMVAVHPVNAFENALEFCRAELDRTAAELEAAAARAEAQEEMYKEMVAARDDLLAQNEQLNKDLDFLKGEMGGGVEDMEKRKVAQEEKERQHVEELESWAKRCQDADAQHAEERDVFETQIKVLESRLAVAEAAAWAHEGGQKPGEEDDPSRVVPKGQGVLCMGCLKQLVHRGVKPLPPMAALTQTSERLEKAKRDFFKKELSGILSPDDEVHSYAFNARKDPYGLARLTLTPASAITKPSSPRMAVPPTPTTGLPALKQRALPGSATALRASMREFRPRSFR